MVKMNSDKSKALANNLIDNTILDRMNIRRYFSLMGNATIDRIATHGKRNIDKKEVELLGTQQSFE